MQSLAELNRKDAILLIVSALDDGCLAECEAAAIEQGLDVLVEVHDEAEMERAGRLSSRLIGVNNRNLRTLAVDVEASYRLAERIPPSVVAVGVVDAVLCPLHLLNKACGLQHKKIN